MMHAFYDDYEQTTGYKFIKDTWKINKSLFH